MSPDAQRVAIAGAVGWNIHLGGGWCSRKNLDENSPLDKRRMFDPLDDLNAMHEVERTGLTGSSVAGWRVCHIYEGHLKTITESSGYTIWHATAAQRSEAFLKTLNLWNDSK